MRSVTSAGELADRLWSLRDSVLRVPQAHRAWPFQCAAALRASVDSEFEHECGALVERFDGGALVLLRWPAPEELVVAVVSGLGVVAAVSSADWSEAESLYAGLAEQLGVLGGQCACGAAIASVYEVCTECT